MLLDNLSQAVSLFGLGIGTVFVLLSLLIACVTLLSAACLKFEKNPVHATPDIGVSGKRAARNTGGANITQQERDIVVAAVQAHRQAKGL